MPPSAATTPIDASTWGNGSATSSGRRSSPPRAYSRTVTSPAPASRRAITPIPDAGWRWGNAPPSISPPTRWAKSSACPPSPPPIPPLCPVLSHDSGPHDCVPHDSVPGPPGRAPTRRRSGDDIDQGSIGTGARSDRDGGGPARRAGHEARTVVVGEVPAADEHALLGEHAHRDGLGDGRAHPGCRAARGERERPGDLAGPAALQRPPLGVRRARADELVRRRRLRG